MKHTLPMLQKASANKKIQLTGTHSTFFSQSCKSHSSNGLKRHKKRAKKFF